MFSQDSFFFFRTIIPRISTGVKVMYLTEVIINWHKEILHLFSATFSSLLQLFLCSLSFSAILSLLGLRSFYYGILNTSFTRILAPVEKQAGRVMAGFAFLLYQGIIMDDLLWRTIRLFSFVSELATGHYWWEAHYHNGKTKLFLCRTTSKLESNNTLERPPWAPALWHGP